jgi:hypothetical protein
MNFKLGEDKQTQMETSAFSIFCRITSRAKKDKKLKKFRQKSFTKFEFFDVVGLFMIFLNLVGLFMSCIVIVRLFVTCVDVVSLFRDLCGHCQAFHDFCQC